MRESVNRLAGFAGKHAGRRCVIIGNGPSLREMDLSFLRREITFGMNRISLLCRQLDFTPTYFVAINQFVLEQSAAEISALDCPKFLSPAALKSVPFDERTIITPTGGLPIGTTAPFLTSAGQSAWEGFTVTYMALQLAHFMGFSEVILIGVDHSFSTQGPPNALVESTGDDPNHFDSSYFGKGYRWQLPDMHNSTVAYRMASLFYQHSGARIADATVGGKLTVFAKIDYRELFFEQNTLDDCIALRRRRMRDAADHDSAESVLERYPESAASRATLADEAIERNEPQLALQHLHQAIAIDPRNDAYLFACADTLTEMDLPALAAHLLDALLMADPDNSQARSRSQTLSLLATMQQTPSSRERYRQTEKLVRECALATVMDSARQAGAFELAHTLCIGLLDFPHDPKLFNRQAEIYYELGFTETAGKMFLGLAQQFPEYDQPYANLGRMCRDNEDTQTAEKMIQRALELNPRNELALQLAG
jgi:tetratricopeptide (TPR) repeat protein